MKNIFTRTLEEKIKAPLQVARPNKNKYKLLPPFLSPSEIISAIAFPPVPVGTSNVLLAFFFFCRGEGGRGRGGSAVIAVIIVGFVVWRRFFEKRTPSTTIPRLLNISPLTTSKGFLRRYKRGRRAKLTLHTKKNWGRWRKKEERDFSTWIKNNCFYCQLLLCI